MRMLSHALAVAGCIVMAATLAGFAGELWWPCELASHFRVQYCLSLAVAAAPLVLLGKRRFAAAFALGAAVNLAVIAPLYVRSPHAAYTGAPALRAMLINVRSSNRGYARVRAAIGKNAPHVVILEEVTARWMEELADLMAVYPHVVALPREDNFGIALLSRLPFVSSGIVYLGEARVPSVAAEIATGGGAFTLLGTHPVPPGDPELLWLRNDQLSEVARWVRRRRTPIILLGDLNASPWSPCFSRFAKAAGLRDASAGHGFQPTWPVGMPLLSIPIDHCLYSKGIAVLGKKRGPDIGSDHYPVIVDFTLTD